MGEIDKKIEKIEKEIAHKIETKWDLWTPPISIEDILWLINRLKECREKSEHLFNDLLSCWPKAWGWDGEISTLVQQMYRHIEQRTKEACFEAGWAWIQDDFGEQFGYDPTDDTDKEDFKQVIEKAKGEQHLECI